MLLHRLPFGMEMIRVIIDDLNPVDLFDYEVFAESTKHDFHAVVTVTLNEYIADGLIDFSDSSWDFDSFDDEQRNRIYTKIIGRFGDREIGILPFGRWKRRMIATLNEFMPNVMPIYQALKDGYTPMQAGGEFYKSRDIHSDFPQTMLNGETQDYASDGSDHEHELIRTGDFIDTAARLYDYYQNPDTMVLNRIERLFSPLITVNINGF